MGSAVELRGRVCCLGSGAATGKHLGTSSQSVAGYADLITTIKPPVHPPSTSPPPAHPPTHPPAHPLTHHPLAHGLAVHRSVRLLAAVEAEGAAAAAENVLRHPQPVRQRQHCALAVCRGEKKGSRGGAGEQVGERRGAQPTVRKALCGRHNRETWGDVSLAEPQAWQNPAHPTQQACTLRSKTGHPGSRQPSPAPAAHTLQLCTASRPSCCASAQRWVPLDVPLCLMPSSIPEKQNKRRCPADPRRKPRRR